MAVVLIIVGVGGSALLRMASQAHIINTMQYLTFQIATLVICFIIGVGWFVDWWGAQSSRKPIEPESTLEERRARARARDERYRQLLREREEARKRKEKQWLENLEKAGRYEEAAQGYEKLGMFEKAGELRRMAKTTYVISTNIKVGKDGGIDIGCPYCGASQPLTTKSKIVSCRYCHRTYAIPKRILDMM